MAVDWAAIEIEYINSAVSFDELAARHGVKPGTMRQRGLRGRWKEKRNMLSRAVTQSAQKEIVEDRAAQLAKFNADDIRISQAIKGLVGRAIQKAATGGAELTPSDLKSLGHAADLASKMARLAVGAETASSVVHVAKTVREIIDPADYRGRAHGDEDPGEE